MSPREILLWPLALANIVAGSAVLAAAEPLWFKTIGVLAIGYGLYTFFHVYLRASEEVA